MIKRAHEHLQFTQFFSKWGPGNPQIHIFCRENNFYSKKYVCYYYYPNIHILMIKGAHEHLEFIQLYSLNI